MTSISELYEGCRTYRRFTQKPVPQTLLHELVDTARKRSNGMNAQPLRYVAVSSPETVKKVAPCLHWAAKLPKAIGTPKPDEQPTAFIVVLTPEKANPLTDIDQGIALDTMAVTAWQQGVGSCILYSVNRPALAKIIPVCDGYAVGTVLALGYPAHKSTVVAPDAAHGLDYYVDADRNYYVPKRPLDEVATFMM